MPKKWLIIVLVAATLLVLVAGFVIAVVYTTKIPTVDFKRTNFTGSSFRYPIS